MPRVRYNPVEDYDISTFEDDFFGVLYDSRVWGAGGTGSIGMVNPCIGGQVRLRASASSTYELYQRNICNYSVAKYAEIIWRVSSSWVNVGDFECGFEDDTSLSPVDWIAFSAEAANTNWQTECVSGGVTSRVDTGIPKSSGFSEVRILTSPGLVEFFFDEVKVAGITTNITARALQPYIWMQAGSGGNFDVYVDRCLVRGRR